MHLVILVDAAHLKLAYKGTTFIYSGLTGNDEAYIMAFGIVEGMKTTELGIHSTNGLQRLVHLCLGGGWSVISKVCVCL